jgi:anti-sigma regulatory factor (Ser/Thr protein kinase)
MGPENHYSSRSFEADPESAAVVRGYVRDSLKTWEIDSELAVLLANELATNAILHARQDFTVEVSVFDHTCRIGVVDGDPRRPKVRHPMGNDPNGRGMALVDALSRSWGVERRSNCKAVWCDVSLTS